MKQLLQAIFMKKKINKIEKKLLDVLKFNEPLLNDELNRIFQSGGKRLRPALLVLVAEYFDNQDEDIITAASMIELIHMASLIHDDVNDKAEIRRGTETINSLYGDSFAVHIGDFLLMHTLLEGFNLKATELVLSTIAYLAIEMSKGEFAQINSLYNTKQTVDDYYYRIERKTAILIAESCKLGAILSGANDDEIQAFYNYGFHLGLAFQIKDDLFDLDESKNSKLGKPIGNDLKQGLLNLPLLLILEDDFLEKEKLLEVIDGRLLEETDIAFVKKMIVKYGGIEKAKALLDKHIEVAKSSLKDMPKNKMLQYFYDGADYIKTRKI